MLSYSERMDREKRDLSRERRLRLGALLHARKRCKYRLHDAADPEAEWRCCPQWTRKLIIKWNSRAFAVRHGCRVPRLYWHGEDVGALPFSALPDAYVVRPMWGTSLCKGTHVMAGGRDLMTGRRHSLEELREALGEEGELLSERRGERVPLLVEEFIADREGDHALPIEYKCYVFGDSVSAIEVNRRRSREVVERGAFRPDWSPIPGGILTIDAPLSPDVPRPHCLDEILDAAGRLGREIGRHVRVDCYAPDAGPVFGELTSRSHSGKEFNAFAEQFFGAEWERAYPTR